jgi:L-seryl-tRNA(Ser) seleniumtransferase
MDKLTLAGLEATLEEYTRASGPADGVPTLAMIRRSSEELEHAAHWLATELRRQVEDRARIDTIAGVGRVGGGALPLGDLAGPRVLISPLTMSAARLAHNLRHGEPPVIVLVKDDAVLVDPRTLLPGHMELIPHCVARAFEPGADSFLPGNGPGT